MRGRSSLLAGLAVVVAMAGLMYQPGGADSASAQPPVPPIAFSAQGFNATSGSPVVIDYVKTLSNVGGGWNDEDTFTVPQTGTYFFSVEFVKDSYYKEGTVDDVYVLLQIRKPGGKNEVPVYAWAGEGGGRRGTGAVSVVLDLPMNTLVRTKADSEVGKKRNIFDVHFSGFLIR